MPKSVAEYLIHNYSHCHVDDSFLASWKGVAYPSHAVQVFALPLQIFTFWMILTKTPKSMSTVKQPLIVAHVGCVTLDVLFCSMCTPYFFFPTFACFCVGVFSWLGIHVVAQMITGITATLVMVLSIVYLFESRSSSIQGNSFRIQKRSTRILYYGANYILSNSIFVILFKIPEDQEAAKLTALERIPCPTRDFFTGPTYVIVSDQKFIDFLFKLGGPLIIGNLSLHIGFHSLCCIYHLYIAPSSLVSQRTRQMQLRFFIGNTVQTAVPLAVIGIPYAVYTLIIVFSEVNQVMTNMMIVSFGLHGIAESLSCIMVHQAYREVVKSFFPWREVRVKPMMHRARSTTFPFSP